MSDARVNTVHLGVRDLAVMRHFYQALGWVEVRPDSNDMAEYRGGGAWLTLLPQDLLAHESGLPPDPTPGRPIMSLGYQVERREDVDDIAALVQKAGGAIVKTPAETPWGGYASYFTDPEGYLWELAWHPRRALDERGTLRT
jgi:catechol 2,3-dioxygenase-like lactoylglutathione lyase family enzyme